MRRVRRWSWIWLPLGATLFIGMPGCTKEKPAEQEEVQPTQEKEKAEEATEGHYKNVEDSN